MDPTLTTLITGCAGLAIGSAAVVACAASRISITARRIRRSLEDADALASQSYYRMRDAIHLGREAQDNAVTLVQLLMRYHGHDERVTGLLEAVNRHQKEARDARQDVAAYQEVIVNQGNQIEELRARDAERMEELDLLETELAATKAALAAEAGQADTWAKTAANLGYHPAAPVMGQLGAAA